MMRFDYLRFEPPETLRRRPPENRAFVTSDLMARYRRIAGHGREIIGASIWEELIRELTDLPEKERRDITGRLGEISDRFFATVAPPFARPATPCVFISHQRSDAHRGEWVACLTDHHGIDYWLDIHDPTLIFVNGSSMSSPVRSLLIAAVIEIALLNSTHVIALHTGNSLASRRVPYEFARANARGLTSLQAAGWFASGQSPATCGDCVQLAVMAHDEPQIGSWLLGVPGATHPAPPAAADCRVTTPKLSYKRCGFAVRQRGEPCLISTTGTTSMPSRDRGDC
jgi:hypothetical protein